MTLPSCFVPSINISSHNAPHTSNHTINKSRLHKNSLFSACLPSPSRPPVLILPGLGNASTDYKQLAQHLETTRGHASVQTVPVRRWDWGRNARGFVSRNYWNSTLTPSPLLDWYFARTHASLQKLSAQFPGRSVSLLGHSAGGWLARVYLSQHAAKADRDHASVRVSSLVTLGTPHNPPPAGIRDWQTRGLLTYVAANCARTAVPAGTFVSVAGTGTRGRRVGTGGGSWNEWLAYFSYAAVCGDGHVDGDGVIPVRAAEAPNAKMVYCQCAHSMLTDADNWYGSPHILKHWADYLL